MNRPWPEYRVPALLPRRRRLRLCRAAQVALAAASVPARAWTLGAGQVRADASVLIRLRSRSSSPCSASSSGRCSTLAVERERPASVRLAGAQPVRFPPAPRTEENAWPVSRPSTGPSTSMTSGSRSSTSTSARPTRPCASSARTSTTRTPSGRPPSRTPTRSRATACGPSSSRARCSSHRDATFSKRVADESGLNVVLAPGSTPTTTCRSHSCNRSEDADRRDLRPRHRERDPGHRHQGRLHQVRRRRAGRHAERREDPPRRRARLAADRPADHGPLAPGERHRARPDEGLRGGGRRPRQGPDRPHRRHRRPRLHRAPARHRLLDRHGPLRPRHLPADRAASDDRPRPAREGPRRPHVPVPGLVLDARLVPAELEEQLKPRRRPSGA